MRCQSRETGRPSRELTVTRRLRAAARLRLQPVPCQRAVSVRVGWDGGAEPEYDEEEEEAGPSGSGLLPDITPLSRDEARALLPVAATGPQYAYYWGAFDVALQRAAASLFGGLLAANAAPLVAVPAGLYFLWAPVALAARRNAPLRAYPYAGLWHARVLQVGSQAARAPGGIVFNAQGDPFLPRRRASAVRQPVSAVCPSCSSPRHGRR